MHFQIQPLAGSVPLALASTIVRILYFSIVLPSFITEGSREASHPSLNLI